MIAEGEVQIQSMNRIWFYNQSTEHILHTRITFSINISLFLSSGWLMPYFNLENLKLLINNDIYAK